jgi:hypothetical protein
MNQEFNIGVIKPIECLKEAWEIVKPNYLLLFAVSIVGVMIGGATFYILLGSMMCGIYLCYLQAIDTGKVEFEMLFKNFKQYILPSLPIVALIIVPMLIVFGVIYFPLIAATIMGSKLSESELMTILFSSMAIDFVIMVIMVCLHTLLMFAFPLLVDRNLSGWQAVKLSAKSVWKNLGGVTGLWAVMFVVNIIGMLAFCVGVYLTIPIILATQIVAYRKVFPKEGQTGFNLPPQPDAFNL